MPYVVEKINELGGGDQITFDVHYIDDYSTPYQKVCLLTDEQLALIDQIGIPNRMLVEDVPAHVEEERRKSMSLRGEDWYASYHTWEEINARLDQIEAAHPDVDIETHRGGQPLYPVLMAAE